MRACWYCAKGFREDASTVMCSRHMKFVGRTHCCSDYIESSIKKSNENQLKW